MTDFRIPLFHRRLDKALKEGRGLYEHDYSIVERRNMKKLTKKVT